MRNSFSSLIMLFGATLVVAPIAGSNAQAIPAAGMARIPPGTYQPLYGSAGDKAVRIRSFLLDRDPVSRADYLKFVSQNPEWRRSRVRSVYADRVAYLESWNADLDAGSAHDLRRPVTGISWFAARAYCEWQGKRLPSVHEWEYAAAASRTRKDASRDPQFVQELFERYARRVHPVAAIDALDDANVHGVRGLHSGAWEWTEDFNSVMVSDDSRGVGGRDHDLYCASAAIGATDPNNYPAFLRHAARAGLTGRSANDGLGLRCAL